MRTTLTLDEDVAVALRAIQERTGLQRKQLVNDALRKGLRQLEQSSEPKRDPYATEPYDPGPPALTGIHSVYDLLAYAEGEDFR